jgi:hypothetical protein
MPKKSTRFKKAMAKKPAAQKLVNTAPAAPEPAPSPAPAAPEPAPALPLSPMDARKKWAEARFRKVALEREAAQRLLSREILIPDMVIEPDSIPIAALSPALSPAAVPPAPAFVPPAPAAPGLSDDEGVYDSRQRLNFERRLFTLIHNSQRFLGLT